MSAELAAAAGRSLGSQVVASRPVGGGSINAAMHLELADGRRVFLKHRADAGPRTYRVEADGLAWLAEADALATPAVLAVGDAAAPHFLALEWLDLGPRDATSDERLGRDLAALHAAGAPRFGASADNDIGSLPQPNAPRPTWAGFYGERRLLAMTRTAVDRGGLPRELAALVERLVSRLPELCGPEEPPSRLHGDLWSGNAAAMPDGTPVVFDPAVYGGHREIDLAMMRLFGGFAPVCFAAYAEAAPLAPGHEERVALYQLYPLLVHVALFGGGYVGRVRDALARYA